MIKLFKKWFSSSGKSITTIELEELIAKGKINLLDVRTSREYQGGHIKGAQNIPLQSIKTYKGSQSDPVYVICHSGLRSKRAASILGKQGYEAINVKGGMMSYKGKLS